MVEIAAEWARGEVAVIGLARSGLAVATLLGSRGARVYASDSGTGEGVRRACAELRSRGIDADVAGHDVGRIRKAAVVVASPGVPPDAPPLAAARQAGVPVVSEVEVALRLMPGLRYIGITGTNGKTTTTALAAHLLNAVGEVAEAVGNIGTPLSEIAAREKHPDWAVLELSSFQLHDTPSVRPEVGVLTNLSPNHLDRYASVEGYYADKALLFRNAYEGSRWVLNADDDAVRAMTAGVAGSCHAFSLRRPADAYLSADGGELVLLGEPLAKRNSFPLLGDHNVANALAAALAVVLGDPRHATAEARRAMGRALSTFAPLEHRIEPVAEEGGVAWINDSKSTNVSSTLVALAGMRRPAVVLMGGRHKGEPYSSLADELRRTARAVVAYGEAAPIIARDLHGVVPVSVVESSFDRVVERARSLARPGDAILLSPACSSFDMFDNYEHRGRAFKAFAAAAAEGQSV